jgi:hypothetical protein
MNYITDLQIGNPIERFVQEKDFSYSFNKIIKLRRFYFIIGQIKKILFPFILVYLY